MLYKHLGVAQTEPPLNIWLTTSLEDILAQSQKDVYNSVCFKFVI